MNRYILVYKEKQVTDMSTMPEEEIAKVMEAWGEWLGSMGNAVIDRGDAFKEGKVIDGDTVTDADGLTSGYTIIEAANFDEALAFAKNNPSVKEGSTVEVYEAFGLPE